MSDSIWRGKPQLEARLEQDYRNLRRPLLNVRDIALLAGIAHGGVKRQTRREGKAVLTDLSINTSLRNGDQGYIEATTSTARRSIIGDRLYSGTLRAATYGPTLFALAIYAEKTPEPAVLYNRMSATKSLTLHVKPEKKFQAALIANIDQFMADASTESQAVNVSHTHDASAFTLRYEGNITAIAAHQHSLFNKIFGSTVALDSSIMLFGVPLQNIRDISQEALEQTSPLEAAQHVQRLFGQPRSIPNTSILDFWSRQ